MTKKAPSPFRATEPGVQITDGAILLARHLFGGCVPSRTATLGCRAASCLLLAARGGLAALLRRTAAFQTRRAAGGTRGGLRLGVAGRRSIEPRNRERRTDSGHEHHAQHHKPFGFHEKSLVRFCVRRDCSTSSQQARTQPCRDVNSARRRKEDAAGGRRRRVLPDSERGPG